jgi:hypothetical protein
MLAVFKDLAFSLPRPHALSLVNSRLSKIFTIFGKNQPVTGPYWRPVISDDRHIALL